MTLLVITNLFPNPLEPHRSTFNERQLLALSREEPLVVVSPVSWVSKLRFAVRGDLGRLRACRDWGGIPVRYPTYFYVPKVLAGLRGALMALSILASCLLAIRGRRPRGILATWAYPDGFAAVLVGRLLRVPVVVKVHGSDVEALGERGLHSAMALWGLRRAAGIVSVSRYLRDALVAHGVASARIRIVYNGVDAEVFRPRDGAGLREQAGLDARRRIVLYVGNLKADKGLLDLLDARVVEACRREGAALVIIGGGPLRPRLEREVRERTLHDDVRLLGPKAPEEVARWMGIADCLCLPSHHEGIPNVILEALSCGLPVLATRVGGIPEVVASEGGVLVEAKRPDALAAGIAMVLGRAWDRASVRESNPAGSWAESAATLRDALATTDH